MRETTGPPSAYVYSVVRAIPNPRRGECVNLGVIVIAPDGHYSDARFSNLTRVRKLDPHADLDSIRSFLVGIHSRLPLHGSQTYVGGRDIALDSTTLSLWSREFGGAVRVSEPRSVVALNPDGLLNELFRDYVATPTSALEALTPAREQAPTRVQLLTAFDRSFAQLRIQNLQSVAGGTVRGRHAHHHLDRVIETTPSKPVAVIEAISFGSSMADVYGRRATICLAAEDLHDEPANRSVAAFALHTSAPYDRLEVLQESAELFRSKGVVPVLASDLDPIWSAVGRGLQLH